MQETQYTERQYDIYSVNRRTNVPIYLVITIDRSYIFKGPQSLPR